MINLRLSEREAATLLAGLRCFQDRLADNDGWHDIQVYMEIASNLWAIQALSPEEMEELAEKLCGVKHEREGT